jgi:ABC-type dipeptide/oligopeptide/nickel transport system permease component
MDIVAVAAVVSPCRCVGRLFTRAWVGGNLLEVQGEDYIRSAQAKGLKERWVIRHALRSAPTPVVTMYGLDLGILLGGAIITERIFNIPGSVRSQSTRFRTRTFRWCWAPRSWRPSS